MTQPYTWRKLKMWMMRLPKLNFMLCGRHFACFCCCVCEITLHRGSSKRCALIYADGVHWVASLKRRTWQKHCGQRLYQTRKSGSFASFPSSVDIWNRKINVNIDVFKVFNFLCLLIWTWTKFVHNIDTPDHNFHRELFILIIIWKWSEMNRFIFLNRIS